MIRYTIAWSVPVLLVSFAPAAPVPPGVAGGPVTFFPTRVGDRMVHSIGDIEYATVVTKVEETEGGRRVTVGYALTDGQIPHQKTVEVSPNGILQLSSYGRTLPHPLWELKLAPKTDETWNGKWPVFVNGEVAFEEQKYTSAGWELVEVPAGKFRAIRVERDSTLNGATERTTYWYAPGLGCVKWVSGDRGSVLKSFTPGAK